MHQYSMSITHAMHLDIIKTISNHPDRGISGVKVEFRRCADTASGFQGGILSTAAPNIYISIYIKIYYIYINVIGWIQTYNLKLSMVPNPPPKNPPDPPRPPELPWPPILLPCRYRLDLHHHRHKVQAFAIPITIMIPALLVQALVIHLLGNPSGQFHFPASAWSLW